MITLLEIPIQIIIMNQTCSAYLARYPWFVVAWLRSISNVHVSLLHSRRFSYFIKPNFWTQKNTIKPLNQSFACIPSFSTSSILVVYWPIVQIGHVFLQIDLILSKNYKSNLNCKMIQREALTHSTVRVFRYDGISLMHGFPIIVRTLSSGICDNIFTIKTSSMRLWDKSKTDRFLHSISCSRPSIELSKLCEMFKVFNCGKMVEPQFSMLFM